MATAAGSHDGCGCGDDGDSDSGNGGAGGGDGGGDGGVAAVAAVTAVAVAVPVAAIASTVAVAAVSDAFVVAVVAWVPGTASWSLDYVHWSCMNSTNNKLKESNASGECTVMLSNQVVLCAAVKIVLLRCLPTWLRCPSCVLLFFCSVARRTARSIRQGQNTYRPRHRNRSALLASTPRNSTTGSEQAIRCRGIRLTNSMCTNKNCTIALPAQG
jgi:hypothetical protein